MFFCCGLSYLVMEQYSGSLLQELRTNHESYSLADKMSMCSQITCGVMHIHDQQVIHADIGLRYTKILFFFPLIFFY